MPKPNDNPQPPGPNSSILIGADLRGSIIDGHLSRTAIIFSSPQMDSLSKMRSVRESHSLQSSKRSKN